MKSKHLALIIAVTACLAIMAACSTLTPTQGALLVDASTLAQIAGTAAATAYGGPAAGQLASAGLSAVGAVAQGYVNSKIPATVVVATPGITGVGNAIAEVISPQKTVTQGDVNTINAAAKILAASPAVKASVP